MEFIKKGNAALFLFFNAFLWGSSYVWSKLLLGYLPRFTILLFCSLGGLAATVAIFFPCIRKIKKEEILPSLAVTAFSILSNTSFMLALKYTSSSNTAFIVQSCVVITPFIMAITEKKMPKVKVLVSAVIALAGIFLITFSSKGFKINPGDIFALCNALFFSIFLIGQKRISTKVNSVHFTFLHQLVNVLVFALLALFLELPQINMNGLYTFKFILPAAASIVVSIVTVLFQSSAIRYVRPERAVLIYTLEPLTALVLGIVVIGEQLKGVSSLVGFALIIVAVLLSNINAQRRKKRLEQYA